MQHGAEKLTDTAENTIERFLIDYRGDSGRGQGTVAAEEVCGETGNMRSSHGSPMLLYSPPTSAGRNDVHAGSPDINDGTIIGEPGLRVIEIRSGDGDRFLAARRGVNRVSVVIPGGYDDGDITVVKLKMESNVRGAAATFHPPVPL